MRPRPVLLEAGASASDGTTTGSAAAGPGPTTVDAAAPPANCNSPIQLFPSNSGPQGIASDGASLWVAHSDGTVARFRASDGALLGAWTGGRQPSGVAILHGKVYITADTAAGQLYVIDPSQPPGPLQILATGLGGQPVRITSDGTSLWTVNSGSISRIDPASGQVTNFTNGLAGPAGIVFDGASVWVTNFGDHSIKRLDPTGAVAQSVPVGNLPGNPAFDGANIWVPGGDGSLTVIHAATGAVVKTTAAGSSSGGTSAATDGEHIVITEGNALSLWSVAGLTRLGSFAPSPTAQTRPYDVCFDGVAFWVTVPLANQLARFCVQAALGCSYHLSDSMAIHGPDAETGQISVTAPDGCGWTTKSGTDWITITSGQSSVSSGLAAYQVAANPTAFARDGAIFIAGKFVEIRQEAAGCSYQIQPTARTHGPDQESGTISVTASNQCSWQPATTASWIKIEDDYAHLGPDSFTYQVDANPGQSSRTGTIRVAGQTFTITQTSAGCSYSLSNTQATVDSVGGTGGFGVTATPGCGWSAASTANWLTVTSSPDGAGAGAVTYSVAPNFFANMRTGVIQVGSASFSVTQQGTTCSYVVSQAEQDFGADGGTQTVTLATGSACPWTLSSVYNWITFPAGTSGTGPAAVTYTVAPNPGQLGRFGVVQVASTSFEVFQEGRFEITGVSVQSKNLIVTGTGFTDASDIIIDNVPQRTVNDAVNPTTVLVGKKSAKHIASGQTVMVEVLDHHTGNSTPPFRFTKP